MIAVMLGVAALADQTLVPERPQPRDDAQVLRVAVVSPPDVVSRTPLRPRLRPDPAARPATVIRPALRREFVPQARWDHRGAGRDWSRMLMRLYESEFTELDDVVPRDIAEWCPAYPDNPPVLRRAFWVALMSALAKHESTWNPQAVGGGGQWFGMLQIAPATARAYGCAARSGAALTDAEHNLACAARIMNVTVRRDTAVALYDGRWRGVAADWGPMTDREKRAEMAGWTRDQSYCRRDLALPVALRPQPRPAPVWREARENGLPGATRGL
ncbi:MAG: transglycosylase SLT domain-containing protein [Rhodobacterales bacterium]|nr:transglycosylase SLT domain-containing protein [Rhodobacterales bacterium]